MVSPQPAFRASVTADHQHAAGETCPYCEQPIPNDRAEEIRARFAFKQKQEEAVLKARLDKQLAETRAEIEATKKAEIEKLKADALAEKNAARAEERKLAEAETQQKLEALAVATAAANQRATDAEQKRLETVKQLEAQKQQTESIAAARAAEARAAMEKHNAEVINAKDAQHAEAMQKVLDQLATTQRQLASVEGEGADINLFEELRKRFPKDEIVVVNKTDGANIIHTVKLNKKECGKIVYDSRNRNLWQAKFAAKLHADMVTAKAMHAILTTSKFPAGVRHVHLCEGVIATNPVNVAVLADILREEIVRNFSQRVSEQDRDKKATKLYGFITSEQFFNLLDSLEGNITKTRKIDEDEKKAHKKTWDDRDRLRMTSERLHASLRMEIARIVGTED